MSMKAKILKELYKLLGESDEGNVRSSAVSPDVVDVAVLLRSCGFRVSKVNLKPTARPCIPSGGSKASCSVQLSCSRSGLNVLLESEGVCRCPEATSLVDDSLSTWIIDPPISPSCSQENVSKCEQAGSSLLPEVPADAAELVSAAVACIMKVTREERVAKKAANAASRPTAGKKSLRPSLSAESDLNNLAQHGRSSKNILQTRSLDDMDWEAMSKNIAPSFQELSVSTISSISMSEEQLMAIAPQPSPTARVSTRTFGDAASDMPPPPRRQSSTMEDYLKFKENLSDIRVVTPSRTSMESCSSAGASACSAWNPKRTKQTLEEAEQMRQKLDELVHALKQCAKKTGVDEAASSSGSRKRATQPISNMTTSGRPENTEVHVQRPRAMTQASILQTLRREIIAMTARQAGIPLPQENRRTLGPAPLPRTTTSPKLRYSPSIPVLRPGQFGMGPSNRTPRPKQVLRRASDASSSSGATSLHFLSGSSSSLSGYSQSTSNTPQRRQSDGIPRKRSLLPPHLKPN